MQNYVASCRCGNAQMKLTLPKDIEFYTPRQCDCEYCQQHQAAYLSDADGSLQISCSQPLIEAHQGSNQASFHHCPKCQQLVAVTALFADGLKGTVNSQLFAKHYPLQQPLLVSPQQLSAEQKRQRWQQLWLPTEFC